MKTAESHALAAVRLSKIKQKSFFIDEVLTAENWDDSHFTSFPFSVSSDNVSFNIICIKSDTDKTLFRISSRDIIGSCDVSVKIFIKNIHPEKNVEISNNFTFSRWHRDILIDAQIPASELNENSGYIVNHKFTFQIKLTHYSHRNKLASQPDVVPYVGLRNQGATCYMNSVLQAMFHIPGFQRIIYEMNTSSEKSNDKNIALNLQRLFAKMRLGSKACSTKALTRSFGWTEENTFVEHDVQEFCNELIINISSKIPNDGLSILRGHYKSIFKCRNVDYQSSKLEEFYDLPIQVKDFSRLEDALATLIKPVPLIGENQYNAGRYGLQDADLCYQFIDLPPILRLHLKRFLYNNETYRNEKLNSFFSFPVELDMSSVINKPGQLYELVSVLVHSGTSVSGHYLAYIRPTTENQWYEFDDSKVTKVPSTQAIENNFGTLDSENRIFSAYLLMYVRKKDIKQLFKPIQNEEIPTSVMNYIEEHIRKREDKRISDLEAKNTVEISLTLPSDIIHNAISGNLSLNSNHNLVSVKSDDTFNKIYHKVAEHLKTDIESITLWVIVDDHLKERLVRTDSLNVNDLDYNLSLYVQDASDDTDNDYLVFIFTYFPEFKPPLRFMFSYMMNRRDSFASILSTYQHISKMANSNDLKSENDLKNNFTVYIKNSDGILEKVEDLDDSLTEFEANNGSMIIIQPVNSDSIQLPEITYKTTFKNHYDYHEHYLTTYPHDVLQYMRDTNDKSNLKISDSPTFKKAPTFSFPSRINFGEFKKFVAACFNLDYNPEKHTILFFQPNSLSPVIVEDHVLMYRMMIRPKNEIISELSFVFFSDPSLFQLPNVYRVVAYISTSAIENQEEKYIILSQKSTVRDALRAVINNGWLTAKLHQIRLLQLSKSNHEIEEIIGFDIPINKINNPVRIELVPEDQLFLDENDRLIKVVYYSKCSSIKFNFMLKLIENETFLETKERIKNILKLSTEQINSIKFTLESDEKKGRTLREKNKLVDLFVEPSLMIVMKEDKISEQSIYYNDFEEAIKFYN
ncbi:hypothetical protein TRFO_39282 [Tritrichomonas foetus]|uniref:ubiquitinyl hydrolase 1 n=1 Tax=Tritrichomonas foetus TaxID=1144522 RepID=A0A1J4J5P3_9EUKA|nr:hypothetical protein TRFO_39282 [Tritrichomonas foetus]|eukprot:OHS94550.1 hypothetical protein TRFO_39282 [Tritrichomonas foetus]